jgi:hypothetical protein
LETLPYKGAILDAFYGQVEAGMVEPDLYKQLLERLRLYESTMRQSDPDGLGKNLEEVGLSFARAYGVEDLTIAFLGAREFTGVVGAIRDLLLGWREKYTIV